MRRHNYSGLLRGEVLPTIKLLVNAHHSSLIFHGPNSIPFQPMPSQVTRLCPTKTIRTSSLIVSIKICLRILRILASSYSLWSAVVFGNMRPWCSRGKGGGAPAALFGNTPPGNSRGKRGGASALVFRLDADLPADSAGGEDSAGVVVVLRSCVSRRCSTLESRRKELMELYSPSLLPRGTFSLVELDTLLDFDREVLDEVLGFFFSRTHPPALASGRPPYNALCPDSLE